MFEKLACYGVLYNGETPPDISPWEDDKATWAQENAARMTLDYLCKGGAIDETLYNLADYLLAFNPLSEDKEVDRYLLAATALALCGYLGEGTFEEAELWRLIGCARLATSGHRRKASLGDQMLVDCIRTVYDLAAELNMPLIADIFTLYERMFGMLVDQSRAEGMRVTEADYASQCSSPVAIEKLGGELKAREWQYSDLFSPTRAFGDMEEAEGTLHNQLTLRAHTYVRYQFSDEIDWHLRLFDDLETVVGLNGLTSVANLAACFDESGDMRYAYKARELLWSWYTKCPFPNYHHHQNQPWRTLETGTRMSRTMPLVINTLGQTEAFDEDTHAMMARMRLDHMRYLTAFSGPHMNWFQVESASLATAAIYSQECRLWKTYLRLAMRRLRWINRIGYFADGFQFELTHGYHGFPTSTQFGTCIAARMAGVELPADFIALVNRAYDMYLYAAQPNFVMPRFNDCGGNMEESCVSLAAPAHIFERDDLLWGATKGAQGTMPDHTSHEWPDSKLYVMRSSWSTDAQYLQFDGAPWGNAHQHEDKLNFIIFDGRELLVDPSIYSYSQTPLTHYFWGSWAHNVIIVDGKEQARRCVPGADLVTKGENEWVSSKSFDFVSSEYLEGYAPRPFDPQGQRFSYPMVPTEGFDDSITHKRAMFYVKPGYWILCDQVLGQDDDEHTLDQLFHLGPIATPDGELPFNPGGIEVQGKVVYSHNPGLADIALLPVDDDATVSLHRGELNPARGWWGIDGESPLWEVDYAQRGGLPQRMDVVLYPLKDEEYVFPETHRLYADAHTTAFEIVGEGFSDTFILCDAEADEVSIESTLHGSITFKGRALLVRQDGTCYVVKPEVVRVGGQDVAVSE